tara:strand:+ start:2670 stop:2999 length:330 start_codon:yes stop_codon:yes gene_type:complete
MATPTENQVLPTQQSPMERWKEYNTKGGSHYMTNETFTQTGGGVKTCTSCYTKPSAQVQADFSAQSKLGGGAGATQDYRQSVQQGSSTSVFDTAQGRFSPANMSVNINF